MTKKRLFFTKSIKRMESYIKILYYFWTPFYPFHV
jgi:hypothetical protein